MQFTEEHNALRKTVHDFVQQEMDPFIDEWEQEGIAPLHGLFKKMGDLFQCSSWRRIDQTDVDHFSARVCN